MRASFRTQAPGISKAVEGRISQQRRDADPHSRGRSPAKEVLSPWDMCTAGNSAKGEGENNILIASGSHVLFSYRPSSTKSSLIFYREILKCF